MAHTQNVEILQFFAATMHGIHPFQHALAGETVGVHRPHHATTIPTIGSRAAHCGCVLADRGSGGSGHEGAAGGEAARGGAAAAAGAAVVVDEAAVGRGIKFFDQLVLLFISLQTKIRDGRTKFAGNIEHN